MARTRRQAIAGLGAGLGLALGAGLGGGIFGGCLAPLCRARAAGESAPESLGEAAQQAGLLFGASASKEILDDPAYADLYRAHAQILTTDVALKFDYIRYNEGEWDFAEADRLLEFSQQHGMKLRGHCLAWNENAPDWLKRLSRHEITRVFDEHIDKVAGRYAGRLHSWDVVNEPFWPGHGKPGFYRTGPWYEAMGAGYIARAFRRAELADPGTRLVLNEAHCERDDEVGRSIRTALLRLIDTLMDQGVALSAVGLQAHLLPEKPYNDRAFVDFLWQVHARGIDIYLSEFDIDDRAYPADITTRDRLVAQRYGDFLSAALAVPAVKLVICWQLADHYSWYRGLALADDPRTTRLPRPLPFDDRLAPKPAYDAMLRAFKQRKRG